jgi:phosphotransferase family enzyme
MICVYKPGFWLAPRGVYDSPMPDLNFARAIADRFQLPGEVLSLAAYPGGHINDSYLLCCTQPSGLRFLLQRINGEVFPQPKQIMENIQRVSDHVLGKLLAPESRDLERRFLTLIATLEGAPYTVCDDGEVWRMYEFIEDAVMHEAAETPHEAEQAARAVGEFQVLLEDLPGPPLHEIIPDFHHTPKRFEVLNQVVRKDPRGRVEQARADIDFALSFQADAGQLIDGLADGTLRTRAVHNDAKMSNVLLDQHTGKALCVIDLDTVMPGSVLYDFGDLMRTMVCTAAEDETDLSKIGVRLDMFEGLAHGYLQAALPILSPNELELLVYSGILITLETGVRFLSDHLNGDQYFRIQHPGHNLERASAQFQLVRSLVDHRAALEETVRKFAYRTTR